MVCNHCWLDRFTSSGVIVVVSSSLCGCVSDIGFCCSFSCCGCGSFACSSASVTVAWSFDSSFTSYSGDVLSVDRDTSFVSTSSAYKGMNIVNRLVNGTRFLILTLSAAVDSADSVTSACFSFSTSCFSVEGVTLCRSRLSCSPTLREVA